jgi:protein-S-isoprenylcysteine O-methyltransferase Ste14
VNVTDGVWKRFEDVLIRYRILFSILIFGALIYSGRKTRLIVQDLTNLSDPFSLLAALFISAGLVTRSWAAGIVKKTKRLATEGPYSLTRHPLYVGSFLLGFGFAFLIWHNHNLLLILAVAALLYAPKIRQEERHLALQFPSEWAAYVQRTGIFFPKTWPKLRADWSLSQWKYNREYRALLTTLAVVVALVISSSMHKATL